MSRKNRPDEKKIRALRRALKKGRMPAFLDLEEWLRVRGYADTAGAARKLIHERRVVHESHPLGFRIVNIHNEDEPDAEPQKKEMYWPYVPSHLRPGIQLKED
jgi:hypothetical protein